MRYFPSRWLIKNWSNKQQIVFTNNSNLTKNNSIEILSAEFKLIALEIIQFENRHTNNNNWTFLCFFSLSAFQSNRHSQNSFHLKIIQKVATVKSRLDRKSQKFCLQEVRVWISRQFNTIKPFATFGQSGHQVQRKRQFSCFFLRMEWLLQVKNYRLTCWRENEGGRAEEICCWLSRLVKTDSTFCHLWSFRIPLREWK